MPGAGFGQLVKSDSLAGTLTVVRSGGPVVVGALRAINTTAADAYVQLFDASTSNGITLGTTVPDWVIHSAADSMDGDGLPPEGLVFNDGVVAASTTTELGSTGATQHLRVVVVG